MSLNKLFADNEQKPRRYEINAKAEDAAEVFVYDAIGGMWGIQASQFAKDLKSLKASLIHLRINSPGGEVDAARAMSTAIAQHPARVVAHIDGLAASAASVIMLAADEIEITAGAFVMVHNPHALAFGNASDHMAVAEVLGKYANSLTADYMRRTGKDEATVRAWMDAETWFSAQEAVDAGLADRIVETTAAKNEWNLTAYRNAPAALCAVGPVANAVEVAPPNKVQGSAPDDNSHKEGYMPNPNPVESTGQNPAINAEAIAAAAMAAERTRTSEISRIGALAKMPATAINSAISSGQTVEAFKDAVIEAKIAADMATDTRVGHTAATISRDERDTRRALGVSALLNRVDPSKYQVEAANDFRGMGVRRLAEEVLARAGVNTRGMNETDFCIQAFHSTSDFPYILENGLRKVLLTAYDTAPVTYKTWSRASVANDFKTMRRIRSGAAPVLLEVPEGGEVTLGTMGEERESYALATYARGISFTRQMLINDDLGAFNDISAKMGEQCARLENKTVYAILTANAAMNDGVTLFHADHENVGTGAIGNTGLDSMFVAMATQKDIDGVSPLNLMPKYLIVPPAKRMTAVTAMRETGPSVKISDQNWFAGMLEVVSDAELTDTAKWYGAAATGDVEYANLAGAPGPQFYRVENAGDILGVRINVFLDFAAKAVGWKGLYYSSGV
jgi:ATP-dependent protease ClpP protease subunit